MCGTRPHLIYRGRELYYVKISERRNSNNTLISHKFRPQGCHITRNFPLCFWHKCYIASGRTLLDRLMRKSKPLGMLSGLRAFKCNTIMLHITHPDREQEILQSGHPEYRSSLCLHKGIYYCRVVEHPTRKKPSTIPEIGSSIEMCEMTAKEPSGAMPP